MVSMHGELHTARSLAKKCMIEAIEVNPVHPPAELKHHQLVAHMAVMTGIRILQRAPHERRAEVAAEAIDILAYSTEQELRGLWDE